jgi:hypothetical protein
MSLYELYGPFLLPDDTSSSNSSSDPNTTANRTCDHHDVTKETVVLSTSTIMPSMSSSFSLHDLYNLDCAPGLILSDSEESSFTSCGTSDDFFGPLNLMGQSREQPEPIKQVRFGEARIREYAITVGDHPTCKDGLPLSLDWAHSPEWVYDIDDLESMRPQRHQSSKNRCNSRAKSSYAGPAKTRRRPHHSQDCSSSHSNIFTNCTCSNNRRRRCGRRRTTKLDYWQRREVLQRVGNYTSADLTRIERRQHQDAVSEFLAEAAHALDGDDGDETDIGPSISSSSHEEVGIEVKEGPNSHAAYLELEGSDEWQMTVQVLED